MAYRAGRHRGKHKASWLLAPQGAPRQERGIMTPSLQRRGAGSTLGAHPQGFSKDKKASRGGIELRRVLRG